VGDIVKVSLMPFSVLVVAALAGILVMPLCPGEPVSLTVQEHLVEVTGDWVEERLVFFSPADYSGSLTLFVPSGFRATVNQTEMEGTWSDGWATVDLEAHGLSVPAGGTLTVEVSYQLPSRLDHVVQYPVAVLTVVVDTEQYPRATLPLSYDPQSGLYQGSLYNLTAGQGFTLSFLEPEGDGDSGLLTRALGGVVAVLVVLLLLMARKGSRRGRHLEKESVEALELRRRLLTDALKTLEVEHDNKKIPDAYYQSIKIYFKQEAVEVLRELDRRR